MSINSQSAAKKVRCPKCGGMSIYSAQNAFRPFCSERCQILDLGAWATGEYSIPGSSAEAPLFDGSDGKSPTGRYLQ
ncbi:MAG: DNA gyrase inhibitor YacG [Rhodocyclaceae bacterium]|nr:DNA gyrase inhibitor YacG [Rhodocyclaceae bacterium]MCE2723740.1 DNA gyrase inhibitor YacG [Betaproteobacteria bacterium]MCA3017406.1 DNA gyrase inhibitor YacG [Rhodocyclaceae bacterium]MCA3022240.1 DNA gyrase inhibitor YacG [Rhodocyclaceae bacterium]MCA3024183.1 DNA gyrase inhibitor YacG [Rhodocyclaceae bacterium]